MELLNWHFKNLHQPISCLLLETFEKFWGQSHFGSELAGLEVMVFLLYEEDKNGKKKVRKQSFLDDNEVPDKKEEVDSISCDESYLRHSLLGCVTEEIF